MCGTPGSSPSVRGKSASPEGRRATFGSSRLAAKKGKGMSQHGPAHGESHSRLQVNFRSSVSKPDPIIMRMRPGPSDEPTDMKQHHAASRHENRQNPSQTCPHRPWTHSSHAGAGTTGTDVHRRHMGTEAGEPTQGTQRVFALADATCRSFSQRPTHRAPLP